MGDSVAKYRCGEWVWINRPEQVGRTRKCPTCGSEQRSFKRIPHHVRIIGIEHAEEYHNGQGWPFFYRFEDYGDCSEDELYPTKKKAQEYLDRLEKSIKEAQARRLKQKYKDNIEGE